MQGSQFEVTYEIKSLEEARTNKHITAWMEFWFTLWHPWV